MSPNNPINRNRKLLSIRSFSHTNRNEINGFSLIELLVVVGVIAILASLLIAVSNTIRKRSESVTCANNMRQIYQAALLYSNENSGLWLQCYSGAPLNENNLDPNAHYWLWFGEDSGLIPYIGGVDALKKAVVCPSNYSDSLPAELSHLPGYPYVVNYNVMATTRFPLQYTYSITNPAETIMLLDSEVGGKWGAGFGSTNSGWSRVAEVHDGLTNALWCDGHVTSQTKASFTDENCMP